MNVVGLKNIEYFGVLIYKIFGKCIYTEHLIKEGW